MRKKDNIYSRNLRMIIAETILTSIGASFSVATITIFWNSIGMDQTAIGFVQMIFTIIICSLDIPMGYIADKFNRKVMNVIGDIGAAIAFVIYAFANDMLMALLAESLLGLFMAMTNGVDQSFIKFNCDKIDESGQLFKKVNPKVYTVRYVAMLVVTIIGGFIAKYSLRLSIGISFVPYFVGGIIGLGIHDYCGKKVAQNKNPIKDLAVFFKEVIQKKETRTLMLSYILAGEITHSQIWIFTPLLVMVGVPVEIVSIGWVANYLMQIVGSKVSEKMVNMKTSSKFAIPMIIEFLWMCILIINTNAITVWLFALNGFVHGMEQGNLSTAVQESVRNEVQTSIMSMASTGARLLYIPLVYVINYLGNIRLQFGLVGVTIIFLPLCFYSFVSLVKLERR